MIEVMFWTTILMAFYWMLRETNWLRVRFLVGKEPDYSELWIEALEGIKKGGEKLELSLWYFKMD